MSNAIQVFELRLDEAATAAPETEQAETLVSPELQAALEELDRHLQSFLVEHNRVERLS